MNNIDLIDSYLEEIFPFPKCELNYNKDYELLIAVMLSARTTDKRVNVVTKNLWSKYKSLNDIKNANINDLINIVKELGFVKKAYYLKEIATILVDEYNSSMPYDRKILESLPGVGRKTVNVVFSELGYEDNIAVDTHVFRVSKRLGLINKNDNVLTTEKKLRKKFKKETWNKRHLQLVLFGRYKCKSISPLCDGCKLKEICKFEVKNDKR